MFSENEIRKAARRNPHGLSIMWNNGEKVEVKKFLRTDDLLKYYKENFDTLIDKTVCLHARFATSGTPVIENCHGFEIGNGVYLMHNGVIPELSHIANMTDSEVLAKEILAPALEKSNAEMIAVLQQYANMTGSKFAVMSKNKCFLVGNWQSGNDGIMRSNNYHNMF